MEPMLLTNWFVDCPCIVMIVAFGILFLVTGAVVKFGWIKQTDANSRDFLIWSSPIVAKYDMRKLAFGYLGDNTGNKIKEIRS